jgi:HlyD family secretion protein
MASLRSAAAFLCLLALGAGSNARAQDRKKVEKLDRPKDVAVVCRIEGETTLLKIEPAGTRVKKGDLVGELDTSALKDRLINQQIAIAQTKALYENAKVEREGAQLAVSEYVDAIYPQALRTVQGRLSLAESDRTRAEQALERAKAMKTKGIGADSQVSAAKLALEKITFKAEQVKTEKSLLERFTRGKTVKKLQITVERAKEVELAKQAAFLEKKAEADRMEAQIKACQLLAPVDGKVVYDLSIEEGADIRKGQVIFQILPDDKPAPKAKAKADVK